jgi:hypothetical protein
MPWWKRAIGLMILTLGLASGNRSSAEKTATKLKIPFFVTSVFDDNER